MAGRDCAAYVSCPAHAVSHRHSLLARGWARLETNHETSSNRAMLTTSLAVLTDVTWPYLSDAGSSCLQAAASVMAGPSQRMGSGAL